MLRTKNIEYKKRATFKVLKIIPITIRKEQEHVVINVL